MYFLIESSQQLIREAPLPVCQRRKMRSRELVNSPQVLQSATGRQSGVTAGSLTDPKPGHLLLKSSAHRAHSRSPPTVPGPAQLPFPPESPHQSIQTPKSVLLPFSTLPRSIRAGRLTTAEKRKLRNQDWRGRRLGLTQLLLSACGQRVGIRQSRMGVLGGT